MITQLTEQIYSHASLRLEKAGASEPSDVRSVLSAPQFDASTTGSSPDAPSAGPDEPLPRHHQYSQLLDDMVEEGLRDSDQSPSDSQWHLSLDTRENKVYLHQELQNSVKLEALLNNSAEVAFDLFTTIFEHPLWKTVADHTEVVKVLDPFTEIIYVQLKSLWPTAARDLLLIAHIREVEPGCYLTVCKSIDYPPVPPKEGFIRMKINRLSQLLKRVSPNQCTLLQIIDADPGGWIPSSLVKFCMLLLHVFHLCIIYPFAPFLVATKGLPTFMGQIRAILMDKPVSNESVMMTRAKTTTRPVVDIPAISWEDQISLMLKRLEEKVLAIETKLDYLYKKRRGPPVGTLPFYWRAFNNGIHGVAPYLLTGYIAMQVYSRLSKD